MCECVIHTQYTYVLMRLADELAIVLTKKGKQLGRERERARTRRTKHYTQNDRNCCRSSSLDDIYQLESKRKHTLSDAVAYMFKHGKYVCYILQKQWHYFVGRERNAMRVCVRARAR